MIKNNLLYEGKAKSIYSTSSDDNVIIHYRDDTTAFNGKKKAVMKGKGRTNNLFNAFIMNELMKNGIDTDFIETLGDTETLARSLKMLPVECVVRNYSAGSIHRKLGIEKGQFFSTPILEFFLKNDKLDDPMINESHILSFSWATQDEINTMKQISLAVNSCLTEVFDKAGIILVDFKLEFGNHKGKLLLGDEFTPDSCRLWDKNNKQSLDKDIFREGTGDMVEAYKAVARRIGVPL